MEENLDAALTRLDMLSAVTNARKEYLHEMRIRGVRSVSCVPQWRNEMSNQAYTPTTKENLQAGVERAMLFCASGHSFSNKMIIQRRTRSRPTPYDIRRKPLNTISAVRAGSSSLPSCLPLPLLFQQHQQLQIPFPHIDALKRKTDKFPVPVLSRSKSLEDLRESPKSKALHVHHRTVGMEASLLLPRHNFTLRNTRDIRKEIDSMSMQIEKLDVA